MHTHQYTLHIHTHSNTTHLTHAHTHIPHTYTAHTHHIHHMYTNTITDTHPYTHTGRNHTHTRSTVRNSTRTRPQEERVKKGPRGSHTWEAAFDPSGHKGTFSPLRLISPNPPTQVNFVRSPCAPPTCADLDSNAKIRNTEPPASALMGVLAVSLPRTNAPATMAIARGNPFLPPTSLLPPASSHQPLPTSFS